MADARDSKSCEPKQINLYMLEWRNGRRTGLKIPRGQLHEGSTPSSSTREKTALVVRFFVAQKAFVFACFFSIFAPNVNRISLAI